MSSPGDTIIWEQNERGWVSKEINFELSITENVNFPFRPQNDDNVCNQIVLVNRDIEYKPQDSFVEKYRSLLKRFDVPEQLLVDEIYLRSNGYFGKNSSYGANDNDLTLSTWFRFEIKFILPKPVKGKNYAWHRIICLTRWSLKQNVVFCFATTEAFEHFKTSFDFKNPSASTPLGLDFGRPYAVHALIIREILYLFDNSVWGMRDLARIAETRRKDALGSTKFELDDGFDDIHEGTRHTVHSSETLKAAIGIVSKIQEQQASFSRKSGDTSPKDENVAEYIDFQLCKLQNLLFRSEANHERLRSEASLIYNLLAVRDANNLEANNTAMKTISIVTMMFLPSTFLATIFSTSFFSFGEGGNWQVSHSIWIYFVWAIPLTMLPLGIWMWWGNTGRKETYKGKENMV